MRREITAGAVIALTVLSAAKTTTAKPHYSVPCSGCHTHSRNAVTVTDYDKLLNLGSGNVKTFTTHPGQTVSPAIDVTDGHDKYAVVLKDTEKGGVLQNPANRLVFTPDPSWVDYSSKSPPYFASTSSRHTWNGVRRFVFTLQLDPATPPDVYALQFETAGKNGGKWADHETFYIEVLPAEPEPGDGDIDNNGVVDFHDLALLGRGWRSVPCGSDNDFCDGSDINVDGQVDFNDLFTLALNWLHREPLAIGVAAGTDDAEENLDTGSVSLTSTDLELIHDTADQLVGIRFSHVPVGPGMPMTDAYVQFTVDEVDTGACSLIIQGQAADNAPTFAGTPGEISSRPATQAFVEWTVPPWGTVGQAAAEQRTPSLVPIIQEIVARPGWTPGNAIVLLIHGQGTRTAESYDGQRTAAPVLHIEFP